MKVLVLTSTLPRWEGDTEPRFVLDLSHHLAKEHDVLIVAPHAKGAEMHSTQDGVKIKRYRYFPVRWQALAYEGGIAAKIRQNPWRLFQVPFFLFFQWLMVRKLIKEWKPDVIHAHWIIPGGLVAVLSSRGNTPIVCTSHGGDLYGLKHPVLQRIKRWVTERCDRVTVVSESMKAELIALHDNTQSSVISMGADLSGRFVPAPEELRRNPYTILFVGRLVEKKGLRYLINIMPSLISRYPSVKLKIIGSGPLKENISDTIRTLKIEDQVELYGPLEQVDLISHYQSASVFVAPFVEADDGDQEGLGLVLVEAAGCECPVVCGDVPAVKDVISNNETGQIVDARNQVELINAIQNVFDNESRFSEMAKLMRAHVIEKYDWKNIASRYSTVFRALCKK